MLTVLAQRLVPGVEGLDNASAQFPTKALRKPENPVYKKAVVDGNVSSAGLVLDLPAILQGSLELSAKK
ncbi:uncharacterized protein N7459_008947 [Penicillium hispanicum]|uniref:uncharacterized protein n=1 Tax=Penicillium hispanicum TaxID=1080232 RepID=UPI002540DA70|nr:uncharacterized protein N7459_008947 [Penicillium hispanicum]KAJ5569517.1 hypothetical protein N7459_008947 [Penicillium hispanicum]